MIAATPPAMHDIGTAVLKYNWRGGHAKPKALQHVTVEMAVGDYEPVVGPGCTVTYSPLTAYARRIGVLRISNVWCP